MMKRLFSNLSMLADVAVADALMMPRICSKPEIRGQKFKALHMLADAATAISPFHQHPMKTPFSWSLQLKNPTTLCFRSLKTDPPATMPRSSGFDLFIDVANDLRVCFDIPKKRRSHLGFCQRAAAHVLGGMNTKWGIKRCLEPQQLIQEEELKKKRRIETDLKSHIERKGLKNPPVLVITKELYQTDLDPHQARFSIPVKKINDHAFITPEEKGRLDDGGVVDVTFIQPCLDETPLHLKKRKMGRNIYYVLISGWNSVLSNNSQSLKLNATVQLWSFRCDGKLYLALAEAGCLDYHSGQSSDPSNVDGDDTTSTDQTAGFDSQASTVTSQDSVN